MFEDKNLQNYCAGRTVIELRHMQFGRRAIKFWMKTISDQILHQSNFQLEESLKFNQFNQKLIHEKVFLSRNMETNFSFKIPKTCQNNVLFRGNYMKTRFNDMFIMIQYVVKFQWKTMVNQDAIELCSFQLTLKLHIKTRVGIFQFEF